MPKETYVHEFFNGTLTATWTSPDFECEDYNEALIVVSIFAVSGTTPTLVPEIEISGDRANWVHRYTIVDTDTQGDLTRLTVPTVEGKLRAAGMYGSLLKDNLGKYLRVVATLAGTTPSYTLNITGYFK